MPLDNARMRDRPQTIKQAKAAFKTRGSTSVSEVDKRRLERGAQLLERASRIKEQEQRRKDQVRKKEAAPKEHQAKAPLLGTQRRLDKFGYKSSQLHLGAFLKVARPSIATEEKTVASDPWDDDDVDDDTLLDIAVESPIQQPDRTEEDTVTGLTAMRSLDKSATFHTCHDLEHWDDFLESSTQLARELSNENAVTEKPPALQFSSFDSADFDFSAEDLEELDASCHMATPKQTNYPHDSNSKAMPPPPKPISGQSMDRKIMPPPSLPLPSKQQHNPPGLKHYTVRSPYTATATTKTKTPLYISLADLESLAEEDIELSQFFGG